MMRAAWKAWLVQIARSRMSSRRELTERRNPTSVRYSSCELRMNGLKKLCRADDGYWGTGVHSFKAEEFEIVELLSRDYEVQELCSLMGVSRSGYYKWRKRDKSTRDLRREEVIALVSEVHKAHPSHGYRWVAAFIRVNYQQDISDNYVYKAFRFLGIKAKTKHQVHYRPRKIRDLYPNLIFTTWDTVDRPRHIVEEQRKFLHSSCLPLVYLLHAYHVQKLDLTQVHHTDLEIFPSTFSIP